MRNIKVRDILRALRRAGCCAVRTRGSHQIWRTPGGRSFPVVVSHPGSPASRTVLSSILRTLRAENIKLSFDRNGGE